MNSMLLFLTALALSFSAQTSTNLDLSWLPVLNEQEKASVEEKLAEVQSKIEAKLEEKQQVDKDKPSDDTNTGVTEEEPSTTPTPEDAEETEETTPTPTPTKEVETKVKVDIKSNVDLKVDPTTGNPWISQEKTQGEGSTKLEIKLPQLPLIEKPAVAGSSEAKHKVSVKINGVGL